MSFLSHLRIGAASGWVCGRLSASCLYGHMNKFETFNMHPEDYLIVLASRTFSCLSDGPLIGAEIGTEVYVAKYLAKKVSKLLHIQQYSLEARLAMIFMIFIAHMIPYGNRSAAIIKKIFQASITTVSKTAYKNRNKKIFEILSAQPFSLEGRAKTTILFMAFTTIASTAAYTNGKEKISKHVQLGSLTKSIIITTIFIIFTEMAFKAIYKAAYKIGYDYARRDEYIF